MLVKKDCLYTGYIAYKTNGTGEFMDKVASDADNIIGFDKHLNLIMKEPQREIFFRYKNGFISVRDLGKNHKLKKENIFNDLFMSEIKNMSSDKVAIIHSTLKPLDILEELNKADDGSEQFNNIARSIRDSANSNRVSAEKIKRLNYFIK